MTDDLSKMCSVYEDGKWRWESHAWTCEHEKLPRSVVSSDLGDFVIERSSEAIDGSEAIIEGWMWSTGVCKLHAGMDWTMPSGRVYRVWELRWAPLDNHAGAYRATARLTPSKKVGAP